MFAISQLFQSLCKLLIPSLNSSYLDTDFYLPAEMLTEQHIIRLLICGNVLKYSLINFSVN